MGASRDRGQTIRIDFADLRVQVWNADTGTELKSLSALSARDAHVHGRLAIRVGGHELPRLGYFGPGDVCFATWLQELAAVTRAFRSAESASYTFDEGEQGQPAFVFEREGERGFVTVAASEMSDGEADPAWQRVPFRADELIDEVQQLGRRLRDHLLAQSPDVAEAWLSNYGGGILGL